MLNIQAGSMAIRISDTGEVTTLSDAEGEKSYANTAYNSPLIRLATGQQLEAPSAAKYNAASGELTLHYPSGAIVTVSIASKECYATFEVIRIDGADPDTLIWGPIVMSIDASIGESVGVVQGGDFAIGMQALNMKTVGGWPAELERMAFVQPTYAASDNTDSGGRQLSDNKFDYEVSTAWPVVKGGSLLQSFARNRTKPAHRPVWNLPNAEVEGMDGDDAHIPGTKIALFGCTVDRVLATIEAIELGEGLPHPEFDGVWGKTSLVATRSYLITDFSEETMEAAVRYTRLAGLNYVYHPDPFENWGHFKLKPKHFPEGDRSLKRCVELAENEGVHVGVHTLSNFTTLNDPYVAPVPDEGLEKVGTARLVASIGSLDQEIGIEDPRPFTANLFRRTAKIDKELIEYGGVSENAPWKLTGVKRGIHGTAPAPHLEGSEIGRLWDHPYDVVFPNIRLQDRFSERIGGLMAEAGLKQISFDGLEGLYATGQDGYGVNRFVNMCYERWGSEVINDASIVVPNYLWHIFTRFNWGEPWGALTRDGQLELRLSNQRYFERNFIPPMLGWFLIRSASERFEATAQDEIEWVLSKAAGFNAGFSLVADMAVLERNGNINILLDSVRVWEEARHAQVFTAEQRQRLCDAKSDWHLEEAGRGRWKLYPIAVSKPFVCSPEELQPGQPGGADWTFYNKYAAQPLRFCLRVMPSYGNEDAVVERPTIYTNGTYMTFETEVAVNEYLVCEGTSEGKIYDQNWNLLRTVKTSGEAPTVAAGGQTLSFSCKFKGDPKPVVSVKVFTRGEPEQIEAI
ncbi:hypothetical protein BK138_10410 [Paenibacillus rhizosphaerae]|uniref:Uncharacterized protein n=1 Tax=Paenibacillus rhizosphaerae TaxID=297318 RepID=A0A1R1F478_9BACL|nr:hypothetical protein [Paenibacillus rhizosphaerae]OMF58867.1 hypothetical protein BK138_10410 [Paenibacillus rhizosphaerae]